MISVSELPVSVSTNHVMLGNGKPSYPISTPELQQQIKAINIKDHINQFVALKKNGTSWKGRCPFHNEKSASFDVNESKGTFKCFGCGEQGNVVDFIMKMNNVAFPEALAYLGINSQHKYQQAANKAQYNKAEATGKWQFHKKKFTKAELSFLGPKVTAELCEAYSFFSLESYTTPQGHQYTSTPEYPMFILDYGSWQKIYQPLSPEKGFRFMYLNKEQQPKDFIYGLEVAVKQQQKLQDRTDADSEEADIREDELKLKHIIKASGERDALNLASMGYNVIWLDSEAQILTQKQYFEIMKLSDELYNLPDIDKAGEEYARKLNLKFLDIKTIWLPKSLLEKKDSRGYSCKDLTDFVKTNAIMTETGKLQAEYLFQKMMGGAVSLNFIVKEKRDKTTNYSIKNTRLYKFLSANGFFRYYPFAWDKGNEGIVKITKNIAEKIETVRRLENFIIDYMEENYYDENQKDAVYRSKQISESSLLRGLEFTEIKEKYFSLTHQDVFFNNCHWRITKNGTEERNLGQYEQLIWKDRIINKNVKKAEPLFVADYSDEYKSLRNKYRNEKDPEEKMQFYRMLTEFPEADKFSLTLHEHKFSLLNFLVNTSNFHWQKEQEGQALTPAEEKENMLHILNKLWTLGYLMAQVKEKSKPYAPIFMDGDNSEIGEHRGGTGKSFMSKLPFLIKTNDFEKAAKNNSIDAQQKTISEDKYKMANIDLDLGYVIYNDCSLGFNFHQHLNEMDGSFTIRRMHQNPVTIPFELSPKVSFTLNHGIKNDGSLARRAVLVIFSDYYHAAGDKHKSEFNPRLEFGKNLLDDYDDEEWSLTYNLLANCISLYLKFPEKINPPMERANLRNIRLKVGETFYQWAVDKFIANINTMESSEDMMERYIDRDELYMEFEKDVNLSSRASWDKQKYSKSSFKKQLQVFCEHHGIIFNPTDVDGYENDRKRIRKCISSKKVECFYFRSAQQHISISDDETRQQTKALDAELHLEDDAELPF